VLKEVINRVTGKLATASLSADTVVDSLYGEFVRLFAPEEVGDLLARASLEVVAEHGVRVFFDYLGLEKICSDAAYSQYIRVGVGAWSAPRVRCDCALHTGNRSAFLCVVE